LAPAVAAELRARKDTKGQQRLLPARMAASGQFTAAQIAEQNGISRRRFFDWMNALKAGGLAGLLQRQHGGGAAALVQAAALTELKAGLAQGRWKRAREIQQWLRERHAVRLKLTGVYYWLANWAGLESAAQDPRKKGRGASRRVSAHALRAVDELERGWWQAGARVGGR
jgi:transposase